MRFAPEYVTNVLNENFEDAKALFLSPLMAIQYAHLVMLAAQRIVSRRGRPRAARGARSASRRPTSAASTYDGTYEDLFFYVERLIADACGDDVAGRLHTARSRNDIDMTMYRMRQREFILGLIGATLELRRSLLDLATRHRDTVFAVHTHTQRAQPTTVAHYLLAVIEQLERDATRLKAAYEHTNQNPLGACAITGTGFDIDRTLTADLLGFSGPTRNTYGSIATVDYLLESASAAARPARRARALRPGSAALVDRPSSTTCASATASCSAAASCRRSAIRWRSSTRARSAARRSGRRRRF